MAERETRSTDVLVVGGGIGGSLAALEAARSGAQTAMVLKGGPGRGARGNTAVAGGGFAAAFGHVDPSDSPEEHFRDTVRGGEFLNDQRLVRVMAEEAPERVHYLESLGVEFERDGDGYRQRQAPGHSHPRSVMVAGGRMAQLGRALGERVKESGVEVHRGLTLVEVLVAEGQAVGAACLTEEGRRVDIRARAVVLATGGLGQLYPVTSNPSFMTGDGFTAGYRAGARLRDMEFVQFTPAGLLHPESARGLSVNHELLAHPRARVFNGQQQLLGPLGPGMVRHLGFRLDMIRLFHQEIQSGRGSPHGGVFLDLSGVPSEEIARLSPSLWDVLVALKIDSARELLEVAPEVHFFMGGFDVDERGETSLPGLFAVGETASGCHGANRLTHNAFPEVIVFAPRAGQAAGEHSLKLSGGLLPEPCPLEDWCWPAAPELREQLRAVMLAAGGPIRTSEGLASGLVKLRELRSELSRTPMDAQEAPLAGLATRNLLQVAELVLSSAQSREESRGSHFREDRPTRDDARWLVNLLVERGPEGPRLHKRSADLLYQRPEAAC
ncbi:MAG: FAD-dependent oxidoreductase [Chloroflexi bacterium]|nr:FAD-dependent oxidoreductase [Chloroflexota bacterium]